ncbi:hypothetical protein AHMF7605_13205 [Adhaeribacter arboris]|uniref:TonB-dependent receptor plug domain-containing protein n=1 Tax=Adhaeribacter arboris TaxID=2072846 RepID=A0A2T2YG10_9BACT|nr:SusC/RagA family TonB-linked outer membrane protein [Adhaeribacter arboris]PSR54398.1 hypothetical protein AHMF7605_13205 [Adhaeribacter arboris]
MKYFLLVFTLLTTFLRVAVYGKNRFPNLISTTAIYQDTTATDSVNTGYRHILRSQVTGAISTITGKQIQQTPMFSLDQALKGRVAGVQVTQNSGQPGAAASVRVRGISTLFNSVEPLYVLDGVPLFHTVPESTNQFLPILNFINPADIASVEILKDAGAAAIYGSRASNGVVLITTKRGQAKTNRVALHSFFGLQQVPKQIPLLNASEYAGLVNKALQEQGLPPRYITEQMKALGEGTNWQSEIYRLAPVQNHQVSYSGGSETHRFFAGAGFTNQQGVIIQSGLRRYNFRLNYDGQIGKRLKVGITSLVSTMKNHPTNPNLIHYTLLAPPIFDPNDTARNFLNPIKMLQENTRSEEGKSLWGNFFAEYQIIPGLFVKAHYGVNEIKQENRHLFYSKLSNNIRRTDINFNNKTTSKEATFRYHRTWKKHSLFLLSGIAEQQLENDYTTTTYIGQKGTGFKDFSYESKWNKNTLLSYFGQLHYSFVNRYFLSASVRKDGLSQFSLQEKYTVLSAISAAWQAINQQQSKQVIQSLKFRTSYGTTAHASLSGINIDNTNLVIFDPFLRPELTKQVNFGADLLVLSNRIQISTDLYQRNTSDAIVLLLRPSNSYIAKNIAGLRNRGLEISITSHNIKGALTWNSSFTFAANKNKITDLSDFNIVLLNTKYRRFIFSEGQSIGAINGLKTDGLYQNQSEVPDSFMASPGDIKYQDLNNNKNLTDDQTLLGSTHPAFTYSLDNDFTFKDFEVNIFLQGVQGNKIYNENLVNLNNLYLLDADNTNNGSRDLLQHWSPEHTNTNLPRLNGNPYNNEFSDRYVENGSFLRIRNLTFAYNLPNKFTLSNKMLQAKVYLSGQNLVTFTKYSGYDPEVGGLRIAEQGLDSYNYPIPLTYLAGVKITW